MKPEQARLSRVRIWFLNAALTAVAIFPFFVLHECTWEFVGLGGIWGLIIATPAFGVVLGFGTLIFSKTWRILERKKLSLAARRWWLIGPALAGCILMLLLSVQVTLPRSRLSQVCGFVPPSARNIEVTGFNAFLASRWLTMFQVIPADFEQIRGRLRLESVEPFNIKEVVHKAGMLEGTRLFAKLPALKDAQCFKLEEGGPGSAFIIYALYDRGTFTAVVFRMFQS